ncbi:uncharacterized mitochondrial protein-like protein [Tanacetum coccineum]
MFDELLTPPSSVDYPASEVVAPIHEVVTPVPVVLTGSPSSTNVDQDAPSPSHSQTTPETQPPIIPNDVEEDNHDIEIAHMGNDPYFGILILEIPSYQSSLSDSIHTIVHPDHQISKHNNKWTKDHPLENIIVYVSQPDGFVDQYNPNHVYKLKKTLYGLKQAPRAWYDLLSKFLLSQEFSKGNVDPILFIIRQDKDILLAKPTEKHLHAVKRIFKYLRGIVNRGLWYPKDSSIALTTYADTNHAGCQDTSRNTSGSMQLLGDKLVSWSSKRQKNAAISSTEAEYITLYGCSMFNILDKSILTSDSTSSNSKWRME